MQAQRGRPARQGGIAEFGHVDIVVNNAGSNVPEEIDKITDANWDRIIELNLSSCMALTRAVVPQMKTRKWGRVIYISSIMGLASKAGRDVYSATKSALLGLARANALELGPYGITANCIAPGPFLTDLPGKLLSAEEKAVFAKRTAVRRWGIRKNSPARHCCSPAMQGATSPARRSSWTAGPCV